MTTPEGTGNQFDLTPHPRILAMLGEIVLPQWRCLAELIDNSIDSFIEAQRAGTPVLNPLVIVSVPTGSSTGGRLSVRDNGPGMNSETLQMAARAGWTSHDPINNLGLFGMGFNIATARLGVKTTIWTTRAGDSEWVGLEIDFDRLSENQSFVTPELSRPKETPDLTGTEVIIEQLKPDQIEWFSKAYNRSNASRQLGRIYSSMIGPAASPIGFELKFNTTQVSPKLHCVWGGAGNEIRTIETARHGTVSAFQEIDTRLNDRPFCTQCWNWLGSNQTVCPSCEDSGEVVPRERRVHGWLGIQRYLDRNDYGIDILRNGRKIELGCKDLFKWIDENSDTEETEYPIDDPRDRGRIVGEIHLDHCRIPYTKDRFVREDAAWLEMVEIVRGNTPLRPEIATSLGLGENNSPLFRLFQGFRRSNPYNRRAGGWSRILVVPDNELAQSMVKSFDSGATEFQTDGKWWDLVEEADAAILRDNTNAPPSTEKLGGGSDDSPSDGNSNKEEDGDAPEDNSTGDDSSINPARTRIANLSRIYTDDLTRQMYEIEAFAVEKNDPVLKELRSPWVINRTTSGPWEFYVDTASPAFRSMTLTPLDALLTQIAWLISDFERGQGSTWTFGAILTSLRERYATSLQLDPQELISNASAQLIDIARRVVGQISIDDARAFFDGLPPTVQENIRVGMASRSVSNPRGAIDDGRFLQYASPSTISKFVLSNPTIFFDGYYWDEQYSSLDYGSSVATDEAKSRLVNNFAGLLEDTVWLAQQTADDLEEVGRERLMRAFLATTLLAPTANIGDDD